MARTPRNERKCGDSAGGATIGYEARLWQMADALRGSMDAAGYKHVCLGLLFLKYISDAFEDKHAALLAERAQGAHPEDPDEYRAQGIFWVPPEALWAHLKAQARQATIGQLVDDAMAGIERDNPALKGVLPKGCARPALDKQRLGQLIDMTSDIRVGDEASRAKDVLGRVYEYLLSQFAGAEGKQGGEFYTPRCVVRLLVEMLEPHRGRVYDSCCGSSGMFGQSVAFLRARHGGGTSQAHPVNASFATTLKPQRSLRVGGDGIPVEDFLPTPAEHRVGVGRGRGSDCNRCGAGLHSSPRRSRRYLAKVVSCLTYLGRGACLAAAGVHLWRDGRYLR